MRIRLGLLLLLAVALVDRTGFAQDIDDLCGTLPLFTDRDWSQPDLGDQDPKRLPAEAEKILSDINNAESLCGFLALKPPSASAKSEDLPPDWRPKNLYPVPRQEASRPSQRAGFRLLLASCRSWPDDQLDAADRFACQCGLLEWARIDDFLSDCPRYSIGFLEERFQRFETSLRGATPEKFFPYVDQLIVVTSELVADHPELGCLGVRLGRVLKMAIDQCAQGGPEERRMGAVLEAQRLMLLESDGGNLAGTALSYLAQRSVCRALHPYRYDVLESIRALEGIHATVKGRLLTGTQRLKNKSAAWRLFDDYGEVLFKVYQTSEGEPVLPAEREKWITRSAWILAEGIRVSMEPANQAQRPAECTPGLPDGNHLQVDPPVARGPDPRLREAQQRLGRRVCAYAAKLQNDLKYVESTCFLASFVENPNLLDRESAREAHALLARAAFLLGRPHEFHVEQSHGRVTEAELVKLKETLGDYIVSRNLEPCPEHDW